MSRYVMESTAEGERLERKTSLVELNSHLDLLGLRSGDRFLDAGAGTGIVSRHAAARTGSGGIAVALDRSYDRLAFGRDADVTGAADYVVADLGDLPFPEGAFDVSWARYVMEYAIDHDRVVSELVRCTRPGGRVALLDIDGHGMFHDPIEPLVEDGIERMHRLLAELFDPLAGRRLYGRLRRAGIEAIEVAVLPHHLYAGAASEVDLANWSAKLAAIRPLAGPEFGSLDAFDVFAHRFLAMLRDPDVFTYSTVIAAIGTVPDPSAAR